MKWSTFSHSLSQKVNTLPEIMFFFCTRPRFKLSSNTQTGIANLFSVLSQRGISDSGLLVPSLTSGAKTQGEFKQDILLLRPSN